MSEPDVLVLGGGLVGSSVALGLALKGQRVTVLDEGDRAFRASRGNFALVWVQSKGLGLGEYSAWSKGSAERWPELATLLREMTGVDVCYQRPGGFSLSLSEEEMAARVAQMARLMAQPGVDPYPYEVLDHAATKRLMPEIGPDVVGAIYSPLDGHVNSLRLFRALHLAMEAAGVTYCPDRTVDRIVPERGGFRVQGAWGDMAAGRVVLAAGLGNARLGGMVGLNVPVRPSKGQIIVTEKAAPFLHYPLAALRQTDEGSVMCGDSQEELGFDTVVTNPIISVMAERAVRMFPRLAGLNVVRTWSAVRVMSADGFPIYEESRSCPGAFVVTCHSGVTLAGRHVLDVAPQIAAGALEPRMAPFDSRRFDVPQAA
jgi:glycine/D-amino acid oxidase-like deaminating enzyme